MDARVSVALAVVVAMAASLVALGGPADDCPERAPTEDPRAYVLPPRALRLAAADRPWTRAGAAPVAPEARFAEGVAGPSAAGDHGAVALRVSGWDAAGGAVVSLVSRDDERLVVCPEPDGEGRIALDAVPPGAWIATVHVGDPLGAGWALGSAVIDVEAGRPAAASLTVGAPVFALDPDSRRP
jgi:hypothetical protein